MSDKTNINPFEEIKHTNPNSGAEYWFARELQTLLEYKEWRNFVLVIEKQRQLVKTAV